MTAIIYCQFCGELMVPHPGCKHPACGLSVCSKCSSMRVERPGRDVQWRDRRSVA